MEGFGKVQVVLGGIACLLAGVCHKIQHFVLEKAVIGRQGVQFDGVRCMMFLLSCLVFFVWFSLSLSFFPFFQDCPTIALGLPYGVLSLELRVESLVFRV